MPEESPFVTVSNMSQLQMFSQMIVTTRDQVVGPIT